MPIDAFLTVLLVGLIAGWLSGLILKGRGFSLLGNVIVGVIGAFLGGFILRLLGVGITGFIGQIIVATLGSLLFVWLLRFIKK